VIGLPRRPAVALFLSLWASVALGTEAGVARRPSGVAVLVAGGEADAKLLESAIGDGLAAKGLEVTFVPKDKITSADVSAAATADPGGAPTVLARVLLDLRDPREATLYVTDPRRGRIYIRHTSLDHGLDPVARESVLFVVEQSVAEILAGRAIGVLREEYQRGLEAAAPPPAAAREVSAPTTSVRAVKQSEWKRYQVAAGYEAVALGSNQLQHGPKVVVAAHFTRLRIAADLRIALPMAIAGGDAQAQLSTGAAALTAAWVLALHSTAILAGVGAGLDVTRIEPSVAGPDLKPTARFWAAGPYLRVFTEVERSFGRIAAAVGVGVEAHLLTERYTLETGGQTRDAFTPFRLRPTVAVTVGTRF